MRSVHVLVETNWVVDLVAPLLSRNPGARELLERARRRELILHVPSIALSEAHKVVRERNLRADVENIRAFVRDTRDAGAIGETSANIVFDTLTRFQQHVATEKLEAPRRISELRDEPAVNIFPLDEAMLVCSTQIAADTSLELQSFDLAILAAVLVRGRALSKEGHDVVFCTLDAHLQPWDRTGGRKRELADLLEGAGVWVYSDFALQAPMRPDR